MLESFWLGLAFKMVATAAIVVAVSMIVERSSPFVGAMIATLPISAGPAYVFLALDHDAAFISASALASVATNAITALFLFVYMILAQRHGLIASLAGAFSVWMALVLATRGVSWTLSGAVLATIVIYAPVMWIARRFTTVPVDRSSSRVWWDVPMRASAVMMLVAIVLISGRVLGPEAAGIAALVPVVMTSLAVLIHPRLGGPVAAAVYANALPGLIGFGMGLATVHVLAVPLGSALALTMALAVCVAWNAGLVVWGRMRRQVRAK